MTQELLKSISHQNVQVVPVDPHVKSAITCKLFNAGVSEIDRNGKSADPTCYNGLVGWDEPPGGLFDKVEMNMSDHRYKKGDVVTIFQMHPTRGLMIEGDALIVQRVDDIDEQYVVRFYRKSNGTLERETYERFVDSWGQADPHKYVREFNTKIGKVA